MASVYLARHLELDRDVALKALDGLRTDEPAFALRFLREARLAGSLSHPNIVTVFDYFEDDGVAYIAMELAPGTLRPYIGHLTLAQVAAVLEGILMGLAHAETEGIVHRDLKPENVLVTRNGLVKIADFGIAKATSDVRASQVLTETGMTVGTPAYMAPEQGMATNLGPWTDLYAAGCMAYELFVGTVPFTSPETPLALLMRKVSEPPIPAAQVDPAIDLRISDWIGRLLERDPSDRPASAHLAWREFEDLILELLGPTWRRDSALPAEPGASRAGGPHTPPPDELPAGPLMPSFSSFVPPAPSRPPEDSQKEMWRVEAALDKVFERERPTETPAVSAEEPAKTVSPRRPPPAPGETPLETGDAAGGEPDAPHETDDAAGGEPDAPDETRPPAIGEPRKPPTAVVPARFRRRRALAAAALFAIVAAGVAVVVTDDGEEQRAAPPPQTSAPAPQGPRLASTALRLQAPPGYAEAGAVPGLRLDDAAVATASGGRMLGIGVAGAEAHVPGLLAPEFAGAARGPEPARLGPLEAYRYEGVRPPGGPELTLVLAPTSAGVLALACAEVADCSTLASRVQVDGATGHPVGPSRGYADVVDETLAALGTARDRARAALASARTPAGQAMAAARAARAQDRVADRLATRTGVSPEDEWSRAELVVLARASSKAFTRLAGAARQTNRSRYRRAAAELERAERGVVAARGELADNGYRELLSTRFVTRSVPAMKSKPRSAASTPGPRPTATATPSPEQPTLPNTPSPERTTRPSATPVPSATQPPKRKPSTESFGGIEG
jgi:serine/threonine protein kinase